MKSIKMLFTHIAVLMMTLFAASDLHAQVVYTSTVEEIYDSNVFLERGEEINLQSLPPGVVVSPTLLEPDATLPDQIDGKKNDDLITHATIQAATALPENNYFNGAFDASIGAFIFATESEQSRLAADTYLRIDNSQTLIPQPYFISFISNLQSGTNNVAVSQGSVSRISQTHDATLSLGIREMPISQLTTFDLYYSLVRHDFLGEFTFDEELASEQLQDDNLDFLFEQQGADYLVNRISGSLKRHINSLLRLSLNSYVEDMKFSNVNNNSPTRIEASSQDRINNRNSIGASYVLSDKFQLEGETGIDLSFYNETPAPITRVVVVNGVEQIQMTEPDDSLTSLFYRTSLNYLPNVDTAFVLTLLQSAGTDINGDRILNRSLQLNSSRKLGQSFSVFASGAFTQSDNGDEIKNGRERFDVSTGLRYQIAQNISAVFGWNYTEQTSDRADDPRNIFAQNEEYDGQRVFVSLSGGLVAINK